jgi:predicted kinase
LKRAAESVGVPFEGLWLDVPQEVAARRLRARVRDASDATVDVLVAQMMRSTGAIPWPRIDASRPVEEVEDAARDIVNLPKRPDARTRSHSGMLNRRSGEPVI